MTKEFKAYIEGADAYYDGKSIADNPYPAIDNLDECWFNGFMEAKEFEGDFE